MTLIHQTGGDDVAIGRRALRIVRLTTRQRATKEAAWRDSIRTAHSCGCSLRTIAKAADISHSRVLQIVREA